MNRSPSTTYGVAAAGAVALCFGALAFLSPPREAPTDDPVFSRKVVAYETVPGSGEAEAVVKYEYLGDPMPEKLAPDEDVSRRTETSYTRVIEAPSVGAPGVYESIFYTKPTFAKNGTSWYYIEHATTTETAFWESQREHPFAALFLRKAHAVDVYAGAGDGYVTNYASQFCGGFFCCDQSIDWTNARQALTGNGAYPIDTSGYVWAGGNISYEVEIDSTFCEASIYRIFLPFDTSSIPSGATISAATLNVYTANSTNAVNDGTDYITVLRTSQATHTTIATADFDQCGALNSPTEGIDSGQRKDLTSISIGAYLSFTLNATGISWIAKSGVASTCSATAGITCLGLREGHDTTNTLMSTGDNFLEIYFSERTGTANDPYLAVTYTGGGGAFWQFQDF